ncbi:MAG TPA: hypothetical protein VFG23_03840, partial [Polyangia bacterium]|nr:hypothetical protein [Polyangia bacterium]
RPLRRVHRFPKSPRAHWYLPMSLQRSRRARPFPKSLRGGTAGGSSAGTNGRAGTSGTGGRGGGGGGSSAGGTGGAAPTFTQIYDNILVVSCGGNQCHNPGSQKGVSFASQSSAYNSVSKLVTPGNGAGSSFYQTVNSGAMPPGGPKLSAANLALIQAWINAGALNN